MANQVEKVNNIAIADIEKFNGKTDDNIEKINGLEFTGVTDAHTLIATATASGSATLEFTSGIDSTYDPYEFRFMNIHPVNDDVNFTFQVNATDGADYNDSAITSTFFAAYHNESDSVANFLYEADFDQAQGTASQVISNYFGH